MSRTYRRSMLQLDCNCGAPIESRVTWNNRKGLIESIEPEIRWSKSRGVPPNRTCDCKDKYDFYSKRNWKRDRKNWWKSDSSFKKVMKKHRKAKERHFMNNGNYDNIPIFRRENDRDWN